MLEVGAASDTAGTKLKSLAVGGLLVAGAAAIGVGVASVKMAADFEQSTNLLITSAGEVPANIDLIRKGLLAMSVDTATSVDELTKGMFNIESAGYHGAAGLAVEKAAAEGAKVENADLASTTDVLTTAMHNYHEPTSQAVDVMNSFRLSASIGKQRMDDLTGALKNVLPIASQAEVSLTDVEAALSTMSLAGDKGASAGTHLQMMLTQLLAPSSKATGVLKEVGLTTQQIADEMKVSLPGAVQMITDAVGEKFPAGSAKYIAALSAIVGGSRSMKAIMELSGISLKTFTDDAAQLGPTMTANSTAVDGWNTVQSNFNFKMQAAKDAVDEFMITLGTKLLPVVGQLADAVTPLIQDFSRWIGSLDQVGAAFQQAGRPIQQVQEYLAPLTDTFDHATGAIHTVSTALTPLTDTFDRAKGVIGSTTVATKPLLDSFDRATVIIPKVTTFITKTTEATNPLVALFRQWRPVIEDVFKDVQILAGDVLTFATGVVDAANKSGFFQSALQFLHDELPVVGTFLVNAGDAINQNLLPPLESLITNVGSAAAGFIDWADKSGVAKTTLDTLGGAVQLTTEILGPLIQAVSDVVGWLGGGGAGTDTLVFALSAAATAFTLLKIADTTAQFGSFIGKLQEGDGIITNLASSVKDKLAKAFDDFLANQAPNLKASMDGIKVSAEEAAVAEETVAAAPADASAAGWLTRLETSLEGVGTAAETSATEVAVASTEMDASLAGVGEAAITTEGEIATVGATAKVAGTGVAGFGLAAAGAALPITALGIIAIATYELIANKAYDTDKKVQTSTGEMVQANQLRYHQLAAGAKQTSEQIDQDMTTNMNDTKDNVVAAMTDMQKLSLTQGAKLSTGLENLFSTLSTNADGTFSQMSDDAYGYLQDVENYVNQAQQDALNHQLGSNAGNIKNKNFNGYASGTDYVPQTGTYMVGEKGPERVVLPRGSQVIPNDQLSRGGASWGGSGWGGGGTSQPIQVNLNVDGQTLASILVDHMGNAIARDTRLHHSRRAF